MSEKEWMGNNQMNLGATLLADGYCSFVVWAPAVRQVVLHLLSPEDRSIPLTPQPYGYHSTIVPGVRAGSRYRYLLDGQKERPDPASRFQPEGVHGPSQVVDPAFPWSDAGWVGIPLHQYIIYELHIGTFTPQGTFDAAIAHLDRLSDLGITAVEIMPVAEFPGNRNWGYDGTYLYAVHASYGGPEGLKRFVDACHRRGMAVILDVVYNHFGPEGNYLWDYAPHYFTSRYQTPWGAAVNFDGPHSDAVRWFFLYNAVMWVTDYHIDALRLDAVHAITDGSAIPFLRELSQTLQQRAEQLGRRIYTIAESDQNDHRLVQPPEVGGYGLSAQWSDDVHHALHTVLTGERSGYYADFGTIQQLAHALQHGWIYEGNYSVFRGRRHGSSSRPVAAHQLVVCSQNHDQVGNRMLGERLTALLPFDALKLAAATILLSPFIPLLFMGEEYGETAPFLYFVSHGDAALIEAVRRGRREEFAAFAWRGEAPDPQDEQTFLRSRLHHASAHEGHHRVLFAFYRELIRLRTTIPALANLNKDDNQVTVLEPMPVLRIRRQPALSSLRCPSPPGVVIMLMNFSNCPVHLDHSLLTFAVPDRGDASWFIVLDTTAEQWQEAGSGVRRDPERWVRSEEGYTLAPYAVLMLAQTSGR